MIHNCVVQIRAASKNAAEKNIDILPKDVLERQFMVSGGIPTLSRCLQRVGTSWELEIGPGPDQQIMPDGKEVMNWVVLSKNAEKK